MVLVRYVLTSTCGSSEYLGFDVKEYAAINRGMCFFGHGHTATTWYDSESWLAMAAAATRLLAENREGLCNRHGGSAGPRYAYL